MSSKLQEFWLHFATIFLARFLVAFCNYYSTQREKHQPKEINCNDKFRDFWLHFLCKNFGCIQITYLQEFWLHSATIFLARFLVALCNYFSCFNKKNRTRIVVAHFYRIIQELWLHFATIFLARILVAFYNIEKNGCTLLCKNFGCTLQLLFLQEFWLHTP
ncbi:MAG: hypothetical protein IKI95_00945 [Clostridia bacterium]|nr:hypothetical protein [Clostridia bacterium]